MKQDRSQEGFSLIAVLALALLATFAAFAALRMFQQESKALVSTMNRDRLEQALDSGLDKAVFQMNQPSGWTNIATTAYFSSLTASGTAYTDLNGVNYWVKVLNGHRVQPQSASVTSANPLSLTVADIYANSLTNTGDLAFDRTVLVMARASGNGAKNMGVSLTAMAYLHRNDVITLPQIGGIYTNGSAALGGSTGSSIPCGATSLTVTGCNGSVIGGSGVSGGGSNCLPQSTPVVPAPYPTVAAPVGAQVWDIEHTLSSTASNYSAPSGNHSYTYTLAADKTIQVGDVDLGNDDFHIVTNGYTLSIYCTGAFGAAGNPNWLVDDPPIPGGHSAQCWVYVVGAGTVTMSGNGNYELVVIAPQSTVNVHGTGDIFGAVVANNFDKSGASGSFHFNECILQMNKANTYTNPPIVNAGWMQF